MPTSPSPAESLARQLLDAQVAYHLDRLSGERLESTVTRLADELLAAAGQHPIDDLVAREPIKAVVARALATFPGALR